MAHHSFHIYERSRSNFHLYGAVLTAVMLESWPPTPPERSSLATPTMTTFRSLPSSDILDWTGTAAGETVEDGNELGKGTEAAGRPLGLISVSSEYPVQLVSVLLNDPEVSEVKGRAEVSVSVLLSLSGVSAKSGTFSVDFLEPEGIIGVEGVKINVTF